MSNTTLTPSAILLEAANILTVPGAWIQYRSSLTHDNREVQVTDDSAVKFCAAGAISRASHVLGGSISYFDQERYRSFVIRAIDQSGIQFVSQWNDHPSRTREEVVAKLKEAAALALADEESSK